MKRVVPMLAILIMLLGLRLALIAPREFAQGTYPWPAAFWLLNSALLFLVCGALTLLRARYAAVAPGLRILSALTNLAVGALFLIAGVVGGEAVPSLITALLLAAAAFTPSGRPTRRLTSA